MLPKNESLTWNSISSNCLLSIIIIGLSEYNKCVSYFFDKIMIPHGSVSENDYDSECECECECDSEFECECECEIDVIKVTIIMSVLWFSVHAIPIFFFMPSKHEKVDPNGHWCWGSINIWLTSSTSWYVALKFCCSWKVTSISNIDEKFKIFWYKKWSCRWS